LTLQNSFISGMSKEWFNLGYLIPEALSMTVGAYFIFLRFSFNKIHYRHTHFRWKFTIFVILLVLGNWQWIGLEAAKNKIFNAYFQLNKGNFTPDHLVVCLNSMIISIELVFCAVFAQIAFNPSEFLNEELRGLTREENNRFELSPMNGVAIFSEGEAFKIKSVTSEMGETPNNAVASEKLTSHKAGPLKDLVFKISKGLGSDREKDNFGDDDDDDDEDDNQVKKDRVKDRMTDRVKDSAKDRVKDRMTDRVKYDAKDDEKKPKTKSAKGTKKVGIRKATFNTISLTENDDLKQTQE